MSMEKAIGSLKYKYGQEAAEKLTAYMDGVLEWNEKINLTAIRDREEFLVKHILDSLTCVDFAEFQRAKRVIDVGTGGGFPGVPLAVTAPEKEFVLLDSTRKKLRVIDDLTGRLGIPNVTTVHARAEELAKDPAYGRQFDLCVSRAVADLSVLAGWCLPFVKPGGFLIAYKGAKAEQELAGAGAALKKAGGQVVRVESVPIEGTGAEEHNLIVIQKNR